MPGSRYWAFLSYSSLDAKFAKWLLRAIESYKIPVQFVERGTPAGEPAPARLRPLFHDRSELPAAPDLSAEIVKALAESRYLIVVCSPGAARSRWVNREIEIFKSLGRQDRILLIIADGEPNVGGALECFPEAVRDIEPIAADARPHMDGPANAKLKIIAGMLGVRFDALKDRDAQLRMQWLRRAFALAASLVLIFAVLTGVAWWQRRVAIEQRELAVQRTNSLRDVLSRLIWRVHDDVDGLPGSVNLKMDLLNGSVSELSTLQAADLADNGLARLVAGSQSRLGMVQFDVGQMAAARASFAKAISIGEVLTGNDKQNGLYLLDLAEYLRHMADIDLVQGDPLAGKVKLARSLSILQVLPPDLSTSVRATIRDEIAQSRLLSAEASWRAGNPSEAIPDFDISNAIYESFLGSYPDAIQVKIAYSEAMLLQAYFYLQTGDLAKSSELCANVAKLLPSFEVIDQANDNDVANGDGNQYVRPVGRDLEDGKIRNSLQKAYLNLLIAMSETLLAGSVPGAATNYVTDAWNMATVVIGTDPQDFRAEGLYLRAMLVKGRFLAISRQWDAAINVLANALEESKRLADVDQSNLEARGLEALAAGELAIATQGSGSQSDALRYSREFYGLANSMEKSGLVPFPDVRELLARMDQRRFD